MKKTKQELNIDEQVNKVIFEKGNEAFEYLKRILTPRIKRRIAVCYYKNLREQGKKKYSNRWIADKLGFSHATINRDCELCKDLI